MKLNGVLDPAVMGGIDNYEKAFLNPEYKESHPEDCKDLEKLENLIAEQIPLLGVGVQLHKTRASPELAPFHQHLEQCYATMRTQIEARYGKRVRGRFLIIFLELVVFDTKISRFMQTLSEKN